MLATVEDKKNENIETEIVKNNENSNKENEINNDQNNNNYNKLTYSFEEDPSLKSIMTNFDNSTAFIDTFQKQYFQFDTTNELTNNSNNSDFFLAENSYNDVNFYITPKQVYEKMVETRTSFMNILLIDLSLYSRFTICGAQVFPSLKQACINVKDQKNYIEIKKEIFNGCYLVFEDQWDRREDSTIIIFGDDGTEQYIKAFAEICYDGQWGSEVFIIEGGIVSFIKSYPLLCISDEMIDEDNYDDDDNENENDYFFNNDFYKNLQYDNSNNNFNNSLTSLASSNNNEILFNQEFTNNLEINGENSIQNSNNSTNEILNNQINNTNTDNNKQFETEYQNTIQNSSDITPIQNIFNKDSKLIDNINNSMITDFQMDTSYINEFNSIVNPNNEINNNNSEKENKWSETNQNEDVKSFINDDNHLIEQSEKRRKRNNINSDNEKECNNIEDNVNMVVEMNQNEIHVPITTSTTTLPLTSISNTSEMTIDTDVEMKLNDSEETENSNLYMNTQSTTKEENGNDIKNMVTDTMISRDPRQMPTINIDSSITECIKNSQSEEIINLRKLQKNLVHNVWYAMDDSKDIPLLVCPPFLYLGSLYTSQEVHLKKYNIKHIIRLGTDFNISYSDPSQYNFYNFDIFDLPKEPIQELFQKANAIIEKARLNHENVLVHCHAGVSRSSTIILAYLMRYKQMSLYDAWCSTFKIRPIIRPNDGFAKALQDYEKMLFNIPEPTMPVVGMSNSYLFSIEYFDFVSRLEAMHKIDPTVPVFKPKKVYNDLVKEVEMELQNNKEEEKEDNKMESVKEEKEIIQNNVNDVNINENNNEGLKDNLLENKDNNKLTKVEEINKKVSEINTSITENKKMEDNNDNSTIEIDISKKIENIQDVQNDRGLKTCEE